MLIPIFDTVSGAYLDVTTHYQGVVIIKYKFPFDRYEDMKTLSDRQRERIKEITDRYRVI